MCICVYTFNKNGDSFLHLILRKHKICRMTNLKFVDDKRASMHVYIMYTYTGRPISNNALRFLENYGTEKYFKQKLSDSEGDIKDTIDLILCSIVKVRSHQFFLMEQHIFESTSSNIPESNS